MKFSAFFTALCLFFSLSLSAQIFDRVYSEQLRLWKTVEMSDGSLVSLGSTPQTAVLIKTDRNGRLLVTKSLGAGFPNDLQLSGALFAVVGAKIMRINPDLTIAWSVTAAGENVKRVRPLSNGQLLTLSDAGVNRVSMHILNPQNGATIMRKVLVDSAIATRVPEFTVVKDKIYALVNDAVWKFNLDGNFLGKLPFGMENLFDISTATDQTLVVSRGESTLFKLDTLGRQLWQREIWHKSWSSANNGGILVVNEINSGRSSGEVSLLEATGRLKWMRPIGEKRDELPFQARGVLQTKDENVVVFGNTFIPPDSFRTVRSRMVKLGNDNQMYVNRIVGHIYGDRNGNCQKDANDKGRPYWIVYAKDANNDLYWGVTDSTGYYSIRCDSGTYTIHGVQTPLSPEFRWTNCGATSKTFIGFGKTDTVDVLQGIRDSLGRLTPGCTFLKVDVGSGRYRPCSVVSVGVTYQNMGIVTARNTFVTVKLDAALAYRGASVPVYSHSGNLYKFSVGEIEDNRRGFITIMVKVKCPDTVRLGQIICNEAKIFADTSCNDWTGAELSVEGQCQTDSVVFTVKNVGNVASQSRKAIIIENNAVTPLPNIQLGGLKSIMHRFPANGNTWRLTVEQEPGHPSSFAPTAFVEGCNNNTVQPLVSGYASNYAADDKAFSVANTCDVVINSCDPNDKTGYPFGYGDKRLIDQNQDIDYTVRFQNTGNDTAFKVVIRDTIDARFLEVGSIEFGASSHRYEPTLFDKNILQFTFDNILLVDSFTNEPASNGYVRFRIKQKKNVSIGSKINNSAAIYFDYNAPIITNVAQHTVGKPILLTTKTSEMWDENLTVQVSPNPFNAQTVIKIGNKGPLSINAVFELFDVTGRLLQQFNVGRNEFVLDRKGLPVGVYIFKIKTTDGRFNSGKIVVE